MNLNCSENYPGINQVDFLEACNKWKILDGRVHTKSIIKLFDLTNKELKLDAESRDFLNRSKYLDLIIRIAKLKYFDNGITQSVY